MQKLGTALTALSVTYYDKAKHQDAPAASGLSAEQELAKKLANPVASLVQVPLQNNFDFGVGPKKGVRWTLNVQPVAPFTLNKSMNIVTRTIVPIVYQSNVFGDSSEQFGLGDTVASQFIVAKEPKNGLIFGYGPVELIPTATDSKLGGKKFGLGPTAVALKQQGPVTIGLLGNHIWSVAGDGNRPDISATFLNPFYTVTNKNSFSVTGQCEFTYDWKNKQTTLPLIASFSQVTKLNGMPASFSFGAKVYVARPSSAPRWGLRASYTLLFPL